MEKEYTFYKIYHKQNLECLYVGKTSNFKHRKSQHKTKGYVNDDTNMVEIYRMKCDNKTALSIEQSWIDWLHPIWNKSNAQQYKPDEARYKILKYYILRERGFSDDEIKNAGIDILE